MRKVSGTSETRYRVLVASLAVLCAGQMVFAKQGEDIDPEALGDSFESHLNAGHIEAYDDVQVTCSPAAVTMESTGEGVPPKRARKPAAEKAPKEAKPKTPRKKKGDESTGEGVPPVSSLAQVEGLDAALISTIEAEGITTVAHLAAMEPEKLSELGGISLERATAIVGSVKEE